MINFQFEAMRRSRRSDANAYAAIVQLNGVFH
jgi:hypothetical protein